jgi:hypothetical protein
VNYSLVTRTLKGRLLRTFGPEKMAKSGLPPWVLFEWGGAAPGINRPLFMASPPRIGPFEGVGRLYSAQIAHFGRTSKIRRNSNRIFWIFPDETDRICWKNYAILENMRN